MTYEEAIKIIGEIEFLTHHDAEYAFSVYEALETAKVALEKQIPKKPVMQLHENRVPGEQEEYYCPTCGEWITWDWKWKCCAFCGQKIDWSEEA